MGSLVSTCPFLPYRLSLCVFVFSGTQSGKKCPPSSPMLHLSLPMSSSSGAKWTCRDASFWPSSSMGSTCPTRRSSPMTELGIISVSHGAGAVATGQSMWMGTGRTWAQAQILPEIYMEMGYSFWVRTKIHLEGISQSHFLEISPT